MIEDGKAMGSHDAETIRQGLRQTNQKNRLPQQEAADQDWESILESICDGFWVLDREWRCTYINSRQAQLVGMWKDDVLGKNVWELFPDLVSTEIYNQLHRAVEEQVTVKFESFSFVAHRWIEVSAFPFPDGLTVYFRDISDRKREEQRKIAQFAVTRVLAEATTLVDAVPAILKSFCESLEWQLGLIWSVDRQDKILRCVDSWHATPVNVEAFIETNSSTTFAAGVGLPGRVWTSRTPIWVENILEDGNFPRAELAARGGLYAAFGFPIQLGDEILGVIECFSDRVQEPDEDLLQMMAAIGSQIGQFMERKRTEEALRKSQELFETFMNNSPVRAYIKDEAGRYIYINRCIEQLFDYNLADWFGKTDFELFPAAVAAQWRENDLTVLATDQLLQKLEIEPVDGERYLMSFKFPFQDASKRRLLAGMSIDITEQIRAQEALETNLAQLEAVLHSMTDGLIIVDPQGNILTINPAALALHEFESIEELPENLPDLVNIFEAWELDGQPISFPDWPISRAIAGETFSGRRIHVHRTDTGRRWVAQYGSTPVRNKAGEIMLMIVTITDITAQFTAEEALRQSEERYRAIYEQLIIGVSQADNTGRFISVNERFCEIAGRSHSELLTLRIQDITHPDDIPHNMVLFQQMLTQGTGFEIEKRYVRPDGLHVWVRNYVSLIKDAADHPLCTVAITEDITERKQAEEALRKSERLYRAIGETIDYGIWVCQPDGRNVYASESFLQLVGLTQEQCSEFGWGDVLHPEDAPATIAAWKECTRSGGLWDIEHRFRGVDGNWHPILARGVPVRDEKGEIICWAGINLDISRIKGVEAQLRESEERFRALIEHAPDAILIANTEGTYIDVNTSACRLLGYERDELIGKQIIDIIRPEDLPRLVEFKASLLAGNTHVGEWTILRKDGTPVSVEVSTKTLPDRRCQAFIRDITERKQAEKEREQLLELERVAREQAEAANRIKDEFLAVLSHELRSPLNPILGWTKLLRTRKFDEKAMDKALETIERNAKLQTQLIEDLLDVSRILQGKMVLNVGPVNLVNTIEAAIETVQLAAQTKGIQILTHLDSEVQSISGDSARLQQIVWNLLSNAIKFTPSGGWVEVRLEQVDSYAQIQVKDTGKGIAREFLPYVFECFRQEDSTTTRTFGGLGLGLAIVRHLVELHGGTVQAESLGEGHGAVFTVLIPQMVTVAKTFANHQPTTTVDLSGLRVLVVDDEADMRELVVAILQEYTAQVRVAASAAEALTALEQFKPDVLISDIGMPEVDGYMLIRQVRMLPPEQGGLIRAIALSAYAGEINQQQALEAGFQMHISKPIEPADLLKAIVNYEL